MWVKLNLLFFLREKEIWDKECTHKNVKIQGYKLDNYVSGTNIVR